MEWRCQVNATTRRIKMTSRADDTCKKCGNKGHWARDCVKEVDVYYKRSGKTDKKRIYLDVNYRDKDFAKSHGARWDADKRKWYVLERVPDTLKQFEPIRTHTYIKPEKTIDCMCRYCFFSFEESLQRSNSDPSACIHCASKKQPPACKHCRKFMVADTWTGDVDDESIVMIHDCVGNPNMYDGECSIFGCLDRPQFSAIDYVRSLKEQLNHEAEVRRDGVESALRDAFQKSLKIITRGHRELIFELDPEDCVDSFITKHKVEGYGTNMFRPNSVTGSMWKFDKKFTHPRYRAYSIDSEQHARY